MNMQNVAIALLETAQTGDEILSVLNQLAGEDAAPTLDEIQF